MNYDERLQNVSVLGAAGKMGSGILLLTAVEMAARPHRIQERAEQRLRRYRIERACQDAADYPSANEETTIVEEIGQLDALTATALRLARDQNPEDGVTLQSLSSALSASKDDILRALEQLEQLQFVSREPDRKPAKANYKLMPAGDLYLKVCEIRELA